MRMLTIAVLCLVACGSSEKEASKKDGSPSGVVRDFVLAVAAGDLDRARGHLPTETACDQARTDLVASCKEAVGKLRDKMSSWEGELPKDTRVVKIEKRDVPTPDPSFQVWTVTIEAEGETDDLELFTMSLGDRSYVGFPIKTASP